MNASSTAAWSSTLASSPACGDGGRNPALSPSVQNPKRYQRQKAIAAATTITFVLLLSGCGGGETPDQSNAIESQIGGGIVCTRSDYQLINRLDSSKTPIYVCQTLGSEPICVTDENNVVSNVTAEVRLLFANTLGSSKPACIT